MDDNVEVMGLLKVVSVGDKFTMHDANHAAAGTLEVVGVAAPQEEEQQVVAGGGALEKTVRIRLLAKVEWFEGTQTATVLPTKGPNGTTIVKHIHVDVTCHLTLASTNQSRAPEGQVTRVSGTAVIAREPGRSVARLLRIENVGLDSQLNLLFVIRQAELVFYPL